MQHSLKPGPSLHFLSPSPGFSIFSQNKNKTGKTVTFVLNARARAHTATHAHRWVPSNDAEPITLHASCSVFRTEITPTTVTAAARFPRSHTVRPGSRKATHTLPVIIIFLKASHEIERW